MIGRAFSQPVRRLAAVWWIASLALWPISAPGAEPPGPHVRYYRADAVITVLSIPLVTRSGVGGGYASIEEREEGLESHMRVRFAAGSLPERAHGLSRLGFIEETRLSREGRPEHVGYFGFMTTSEERSVREARRALNPAASGCTRYSVMAGTLTAVDTESRKASFCADGLYSWANWGDLTGRAQAALGMPVLAVLPPTPEKTSVAGAMPMLCALVDAIREDAEAGRRTFVWGARRYTLSTRKEVDAGMGSRLAARGLTARPEAIARLTGAVRGAGKQSNFRLWFEHGADNPLPLRIEYRPRSFLYLIFEAVSEANLAAAGAGFRPSGTAPFASREIP